MRPGGAPWGAALHNIRQRQRKARDNAKFEPLVESPADLGSAADGGSLSAFELRANARLGISLDVATDDEDITVSVGSDVYGWTARGAGEVLDLPWSEEGRELVVNRTGAPAGTVNVWLLDQWRRPTLIASGTFS